MKMRMSTKCVHVGAGVDKETGAIRRPIYMNNSYQSTSFVASKNEGGDPVFGYVRDGHANQFYLEQRLAAIEGGEDCVVVASGVAANNGTFLTLLSTGDHIVCGNPCYYSVFKFLKDHLAQRLGIGVTFVNATDMDEVKRAIQPNTRIIHIETPNNPITRIIDIAAVARIAKSARVLLTVDSTWGTPILQRPIELGADLVIHSLTKYINGHGDSLGGAVIGRKALIDKIRIEGMVRLGHPISPFNAWLIMRGMSTLPLRMKQHCVSAMKIAKFLESHRRVEFVRYPGLKSHPQHRLAKKQMSGFSGMINFRLKCSTAKHDKFVKQLKVITPAVSLGHDESLILHHPMIKGIDPWYDILKETTEDFGKGFLRFSVGLEDTDDLIDDLKQAIKKVT